MDQNQPNANPGVVDLKYRLVNKLNKIFQYNNIKLFILGFLFFWIMEALIILLFVKYGSLLFRLPSLNFEYWFTHTDIFYSIVTSVLLIPILIISKIYRIWAFVFGSIFAAILGYPVFGTLVAFMLYAPY